MTLPKVKKEVVEEFNKSFIASDKKQEYNSYPYYINPSLHEELVSFLLSSISQAYQMGAKEKEKEILGYIGEDEKINHCFEHNKFELECWRCISVNTTCNYSKKLKKKLINSKGEKI